MSEALYEIVDEGDQLVSFALQVHQVGLYLALHSALHIDGVGVQTQGGLYRLWSCQG